MPKKNVNEIEAYYQKQNVAGSYDDRRFSGKGGQYINLTEVNSALSLLNHNTQKKLVVLDVGSGRGRLSIPLSRAGLDVYCLDSSKAMSKTLEGFIPKSHILIQSAFDNYGFKNKFDYITSLRFFDHFDIKDQKKLLKIMTNKLKKDGQIIYLCLNKSSLESFLSYIFPYGRYNYYYNNAEYQKLFRTLRLKVVKTQSFFFIPRGAFLYLQNIPLIIDLAIFLDRLLRYLFPSKGALCSYSLKRS